MRSSKTSLAAVVRVPAVSILSFRTIGIPCNGLRNFPAFASASNLHAAGYPDHPVKVIVPFPAGGVTDIATRVIVQRLSERLGQQFYVENIGGAGGNIGMGDAAHAAGDGYTILFSTAASLTGVHVRPRATARELRDMNDPHDLPTLEVQQDLSLATWNAFSPSSAILSDILLSLSPRLIS